MSSIKLISLFFIYCYFRSSHASFLTHSYPKNVIYLEPGKPYKCDQVTPDALTIYCYAGKPKHLIHVWETVQVDLSLPPEEFQQFDGYSAEEVYNKFGDARSSWTFSLFSVKKKIIKLDPFNRTCIGISTDKDYTLTLNVKRVDYWKVLLLASGILLFFTASKLSSNSVFYYLTGVSFGICACFLILIFFISRLMPRKPIMYSFLIGGWTVGLYLGQILLDNMKTIAIGYKPYVLGYIGVTGLLSFGICYKFGPVSDPKSINLIKWTLQVVGMGLILLSSDFQEVAIAVNILILTLYNIPFKYWHRPYYVFKNYWYPYKPRLLSEDEYHQQGAVETKKALDDLRRYCSSPDCNPWDTILKLKKPLRYVILGCSNCEKPVYSKISAIEGNGFHRHFHTHCCHGHDHSEYRFAKFVEGSSHIDDNEVLAFDTDIKNDDLLTDDSSDDD